jgi:hypothetical protein
MQVTDPRQVAAINRHYNFALVCEDQEVKKKSKGKFKTLEESLYYFISRKQFNPNELL